MWRHLPPVHSPLSLGALWRGVASATRTGSRDSSRAAVLDALRVRQGGADLIFLDSGTSALGIAIGLAIGSSGKAVAIPAYGCFDLATAVDAARCPFVLYDVDPVTLGPDLRSLRGVLTADVGAVVIAHLYGIPVNIAVIRQMASAVGAHVIDDAAQGIGASLTGEPLGSGGALGVLSFGRGKGLTGGGGGALVVPPDSPLADAAREAAPLDSHTGWGRPLLTTLAQWALARPGLYGIPAALPFLGLGETVYRAPEPAEAISRFAVGVLAETVVLADSETATRRRHAATYREALAAAGLELPELAGGSNPGYLRFPLLLPDGMSSAEIGVRARRLGIMPGYPRSLRDLEGFGARGLWPERPLQGARILAERLITLPTHGKLGPRDLAAVLAWVGDLRRS